MGKFMYPIVIKREPQQVSYVREIELQDGMLTLAELKRHVTENELFSIGQQEVDRYIFKTILYVRGKRLETQDEVDIRVAKEEKYMENYHIFHGTQPK